jgi:hypothetical protein
MLTKKNYIKRGDNVEQRKKIYNVDQKKTKKEGRGDNVDQKKLYKEYFSAAIFLLLVYRVYKNKEQIMCEIQNIL